MNKHTILFITGLSGAGLSTALKALEDEGFEGFDNFPLSQIKIFLSETTTENTPLAFAFDTRTRGFTPENIITLAQEIKAQILFLTATNTCLQQRFSETRRLHPMAKNCTIMGGIQHERKWLAPIIDHATHRIDTTELNIHELKHIVQNHFPLSSQKNGLSVSMISFGFKHGIPREADIVMDVRFLKNPHWDKRLRKKSGKDKAVGAYINTDPTFEQFITNFQAMLTPLFPQYQAEGKHYLTIAIGCTGGKHRSVYSVETLKQWLKTQKITTHIMHRDLEKN